MSKKFNIRECYHLSTAIQIFRGSPLQAKSTTYFLWVAFLCLLSLVSAFTLEHVGGYPPCAFCIYERWPYVIAFVAGIIGISISRAPLDIWLMFICMASFFIGLILSVYHIGIEHHWVEMPKACTGGTMSSSLTLNELKTILLKRKIVPCDQVPLKVFGLSLVEYNAIISFILFLCSFRLTLKFFKRWQTIKKT